MKMNDQNNQHKQNQQRALCSICNVESLVFLAWKRSETNRDFGIYTKQHKRDRVS